MPAVAADDGIACRQSKAASLLLRREIGIEDLRKVLLRDPGPMIHDGYQDIFPLRQRKVALVDKHVPAIHLHGPPLAHRVGGVDDDVVEHLADLPFVRLHVPKVVGKREFTLDVGSPQNEVRRLLRQFLQRDRPLDGRSALRKRQQLMGQVSRPFRRLLGFLQPPVHLALAVRIHFRQRDVPEDRRQEVVEIVGDPSGQDADRIQLVAPRHLLFQFFPLRDVSRDGRERDRLAGVIVPDDESVDLDGNRRSRPEVTNPGLALPGPFLREGRKHLLQGLEVLLQGEVLDPPSPVFSQAVQTDELQAGLVQVKDLPVQRGDPDEVGAVLDEGHEDLLLLLRLHPLRNVPADADDEVRAAPADEPRADFRGDAPAVLRLVLRLEEDGPIAPERRHPTRAPPGMLRCA